MALRFPSRPRVKRQDIGGSFLQVYKENRLSVGFSGTRNNATPYPYYSHTTPIRIPKDMGIVREAYHGGVPLLGVPGITLEIVVSNMFFMFYPDPYRHV